MPLRDLWWKDGTKDGSAADDGDDSRDPNSRPFGDNVTEDITPRMMRDFAYEIGQAIIAAGSGSAAWVRVGNGTNGVLGHLYFAIGDTEPPFVGLTPADWTDRGSVMGPAGPRGVRWFLSDVPPGDPDFEDPVGAQVGDFILVTAGPFDGDYYEVT